MKGNYCARRPSPNISIMGCALVVSEHRGEKLRAIQRSQFIAEVIENDAYYFV